MSIEFKEGNYYIGIWFMNIPKAFAPTGGDFMACVYRDDVGDKKWHLKYRFRYYEGDDPSPFNDPDDPMGSVDRKNWYHATADGDKSVDEMQQTNDEALRIMAGISGVELQFFPIHGDAKVFANLCNEGKLPPFMHQKIMPTELEDGTTAA